MGLWARFIPVERAAFEIFPIQGADGTSGIGVIGPLDETGTSGLLPVSRRVMMPTRATGP